MRTLVEHLHRVQELHIDPEIGPVELDRTLLMALSRPAPLLESLTLLGVRLKRESDNDSDLLSLFRPEAPRLRQVAVSPWLGNHFSGITHFCWSSATWTSVPSTSEFVQFLRASPLLQELVVTDKSPAKSGLRDPEERVPLSQLKHLRLGCMKPKHAARILSLVAIPRTTTVRIWDVWWDWHNENTGDLSSCFPSDLSGLPGLQDITVIRCVQREGQHLRLTAASDGDAWWDIIGPIVWRSDTTWDPISDSYARTLGRVPDIILGQNIRELWIGNSETAETPFHDTAVWKSLLCNTPSLVNLIIFHMNAGNVLDSLSAPALDADSVVCPGLKELQFIHISDIHLATLVEYHLSRLWQSRIAIDRPIERVRFVLKHQDNLLRDLLVKHRLQNVDCVVSAEPEFHALPGGLNSIQERALTW